MRNNEHWQREDYRQRMTTAQWKKILLRGEDTIIVRGRLRTLKARNLDAGVVEIYKEPIKD